MSIGQCTWFVSLYVIFCFLGIHFRTVQVNQQFESSSIEKAKNSSNELVILGSLYNFLSDARSFYYLPYIYMTFKKFIGNQSHSLHSLTLKSWSGCVQGEKYCHSHSAALMTEKSTTSWNFMNFQTTWK